MGGLVIAAGSLDMIRRGLILRNDMYKSDASMSNLHLSQITIIFFVKKCYYPMVSENPMVYTLRQNGQPHLSHINDRLDELWAMGRRIPHKLLYALMLR